MNQFLLFYRNTYRVRVHMFYHVKLSFTKLILQCITDCFYFRSTTVDRHNKQCFPTFFSIAEPLDAKLNVLVQNSMICAIPKDPTNHWETFVLIGTWVKNHWHRIWKCNNSICVDRSITTDTAFLKIEHVWQVIWKNLSLIC
jgi:hypothetical protein